MYTITRQQPYYANQDRDKPLYTVEVVRGDFEQSGSDCLTPAYKFLGEWETYLSAVEAVEQAIKLRNRWREDTLPNDFDIEIAFGATHDGMFELDSDNDSQTDEELLEVAKKLDEDAPRCQWCGDFIGQEKYGNEDTVMFGEYPFCSEHCADRAYWEADVMCGVCEKECRRSDMHNEWQCEACYENEQEEAEEKV